MNKKKSLLLIVGLVGLILGSTLLYNVLAHNYEEEQEDVLAVEEQAVTEDELAMNEATDTSEVIENTIPEDEFALEAQEDLSFMGSDEITVESSSVASEEESILSQDATKNEVINTPTSGASDSANTGSTNIGSTNTQSNNTSNSQNNGAINNSGNNTNSQNNSSINKPTQGITSVPTQGATNSTPTTTIAPTKAPVTVAPTATPVPTATPAPTATPVPTKVPANVNTAANFTVQTYSGSNVSLSSNFGKPIVINFWASWCGPCKSEMADFNTVYKEYKDKVVFMMVDMVDGSRETKADGYNYVTGQGYSFPVYYDVNQSAAYAYGITSYPTTYFIDANGNVSTYSKGAMSASTLRSQLNKLINQ